LSAAATFLWPHSATGRAAAAATGGDGAAERLERVARNSCLASELEEQIALGWLVGAGNGRLEHASGSQSCNNYPHLSGRRLRRLAGLATLGELCRLKSAAAAAADADADADPLISSQVGHSLHA